MVLILVLVEDGLRVATSIRHQWAKSEVLILVLVEDGLRVSEKAWKEHWDAES